MRIQPAVSLAISEKMTLKVTTIAVFKYDEWGGEGKAKGGDR